MDLKDFLVRFHPGIVKSYERQKEQLQPPKSAPGNLVFTQQSEETKFPFPPNSPSLLPLSPSSPAPSDASIDLLEVIPETQLEFTSSPTPTPSEASTHISSPVKVIPETQLSPYQSPAMKRPCLSQEDAMQFRNRIEFVEFESSPE